VAGARAVVRAHRRAQAVDVWFGVVIPHPAARRIFTITGADTLIRIYPSLTQALAAAQREAAAGHRTGRQAPAHGHATGQPDRLRSAASLSGPLAGLPAADQGNLAAGQDHGDLARGEPVPDRDVGVPGLVVHGELSA
jgi:hypothetical protein